MAAYAAMAHIVSVRPRRPGDPSGAVVLATVPRADIDAVAEDLSSLPLDDRLAERWSHIRVGWAQTTFFLFDPESWR